MGTEPVHASLLARSKDLVYRYRLQEPAGFEYVSPSAFAITGYTAEEHYADPGLGLKLVHPDDRHRLEQLRNGAGDQVLLLRWIHKDGRTVWTEQHNVLIRDESGAPLAVEGIARDVTEREVAVARLRESEQRYRSLVVAMAEGVVMQDVLGRIVMCNPAAERILGRTFEEMQGLTSLDPRWAAVYEDGSPYTSDQHPSTITRLTGRSIRNELMGVHRADGSLVWVLVNTEPLAGHPGGPPHWVVVSFADITALRDANQKLRAALAVVRTLSGHLPICSYCKNVRTDSGYWEQIEQYLRARTDAQFSHGICPECLRTQFPEHVES